MTLVLQAVEWSYNFEEVRNVQITGNDRTGTIFVFIVVGIAIATILGWVGFRAYNIVKEADYIDNIAERVVDLDRNIREKGRDSEPNQPRGLLSRDAEISDDIDNL